MIDRAKSTIGNGCITDNTPILIARNFYPKSFIDKIRDEKECSTHLQYQLKFEYFGLFTLSTGMINNKKNYKVVAILFMP